MTKENKKSKVYDYPEAVVGALIVNDDEKVLLAKSDKWSGKWTIFGGHVELGEKMKVAVLREVKEETGLEVEIETQLDFMESIFDKDFNGKRHFIFLDYVCRFRGNEEVKLNEEFEGEHAWFSIDEAKKLDLPDGDKKIIENYLKYKEQKNLLENWKRSQADFENYKKMQAESQKDLLKYATQNIILQIIPVLDNFQMSTAHVPEEQKDNGWVTGIMYIQKQLETVLVENGVDEIAPKVGDNFDPVFHEAIADKACECDHCDCEKEKEKFKNKIKKVMMNGYKIGDKVIRAARVVAE